MDEAEQEQQNRRVLTLLEALKKTSKDLRSNPISPTNTHNSETTVEALSKLEAEAAAVVSTNPNLFNLHRLLCSLKTLLETLEKSQGYSFKPLLRRQITNFRISQAACKLEAEIQAFLDRESVQNLVRTLQESADEEQKIKVLADFRKRVGQGFDRDFQELVLRAKVFSILESLLCDSMCSKRVRDEAALVVDALVRFNKNVFVGLVFMGPTINGALTSIGSCCSIQVLCSLIKFIRTPLIDEMESNGEIRRIINLLSTEDLSIRAAALDCILELAYFGRKEVVEEMLEEKLVEKLMELQRLEHGSDEIERENNGEVCVEAEVENNPFGSCVASFSVQVEVGEGLSKIEKREVKREILRRVREASVSEAESSAIEAEVLWGSSP